MRKLSGKGTLSGRTALVAGGAGFLGSHLCRSLIDDGMRVICLDNFLTGRTANLAALEAHPAFELFDCDIIDPLPAALRRGQRRLDYIYNLACAASPPHYQEDPEHTMLTSVMGTRNLLRLAEATGARLLQASTSEVYGDPETHPQREDYWGNVNPTGPRACYDEGKRAAEALCYDFERAKRASVRVARIFNTYGPHMRADDGRVVSNMIVQALADAPLTIYGDGSQTRSFCFVDDTVAGLRRLAEHPGSVPGPVNIGANAEITVKELARIVLRLTGSASSMVSQPLPVDDPRRRQPDISLARRVIGWAPTTPLDLGLRATIGWFMSSLAKPLAVPRPAPIVLAVESRRSVERRA